METRRIGAGLWEVLLHCRQTGMGAKTYFLSPSPVRTIRGGRTHWTEVVRVHPGDEIVVINTSNSGKHNCYRARVQGDGSVAIVEQGDAWGCPVCTLEE